MLNLLLAFLDELVALWGTALLAGLAATGRLHWPAMVLGGLLFAMAWGLWAAPRSPRRLRGRRLALFKAAAFGLGTLGLALADHSGWAWGLALTAVLTLVPLDTLLADWQRRRRPPAPPTRARSLPAPSALQPPP